MVIFFVKITLSTHTFKKQLFFNSAIDHIFLSSSLIDDVLAYSVVDNIANLSDHLPVLCDIRVAEHTDSNAKCIGNKSKHVNCVRRWNKTDLGLFYSKSAECLHIFAVDRARCLYSLLNSLVQTQEWTWTVDCEISP